MSNPPTIDIAGPPHAPEVLATERTSCASELRRPPLGGDQPRPLGSTICGRTWMHVIFPTGADRWSHPSVGTDGTSSTSPAGLSLQLPGFPAPPVHRRGQG